MYRQYLVWSRRTRRWRQSRPRGWWAQRHRGSPQCSTDSSEKERTEAFGHLSGESRDGQKGRQGHLTEASRVLYTYIYTHTYKLYIIYYIYTHFEGLRCEGAEEGPYSLHALGTGPDQVGVLLLR